MQSPFIYRTVVHWTSFLGLVLFLSMVKFFLVYSTVYTFSFSCPFVVQRDECLEHYDNRLVALHNGYKVL